MGVAFCTENQLEGGTFTSSSTDEGTGLPYERIEDGRRPRRAYGHGDVIGETFYWVTEHNKFVDFDEGSGEINAALTEGVYTGTQLQSHLISVLNAAGTQTYLATWDVIGDGIWSIGPTTGTVELLFSSGANAANSIANLLNYDTGADIGPGAGLDSSPRWGNVLFLVLDMGADISPELHWLQLYGDDGTDFDGLIRIFGASSDLGDDPQSWISSAGLEMEPSPRGNDASIVPAQLALNTGDAAHRYWAFLWSYEDSSPVHRVGIWQAFDPLTSENYNVQEIAAHGLTELTPDMTMDAEYAVESDQAWAIDLDFELWPATEWRSVVLPVVKLTKAVGFGFVLNYDQVLSGERDAENEVDHGHLFWACRQGGHSGRYGGASSDYVTDSLALLQRT